MATSQKTRAEQDAAAADLQAGTGVKPAGDAQPAATGENKTVEAPVVDIEAIVNAALAKQKAELSEQFEQQLGQQKQEFAAQAKEFVDDLKKSGGNPGTAKLKVAVLTEEEALLKHYGEGYVIAKHGPTGTVNTFSKLAWKNLQESGTAHGYTALPEAPPEVKNLK